MGFFRRARDLPGNISHMDTMILLLLLVGLLWFVGFINPQRFIGPIRSGPTCTSMASPDSDNSRSLLAVMDEQQELELAINVDQQVAPNGTLRIDVLFINPDQGPIILFLPETITPGVIMAGQTGRSATVNVVITNVTSNQSWGVYPGAFPPGTGVPATAFNQNDLYLLLAGEQCYVRYEFTFDQLATAGITPGQYRVQGFYTNTHRGVFVNNSPIDPTTGLQPTAAFSDQGVWAAGTLQTDNDLLFNVLATAATPVP